MTDDVVWYIEHSLLCDSLGEDGNLRDVEVKSTILLEDFLELIQDLKYHVQLGLNVSVIHTRTRPDLWVR